ncbi:calcium/calmodulin-dependent protein kinase type 1B [Apiospora rasikravindrae]|uniref:Calcium/calmodulin-dependent protein kinase type 1B n=1 Tax=Apiospora rasikravindrae TaxID=990691 RepID=A0ABR1RTH9_9PEZI
MSSSSYTPTWLTRNLPDLVQDSRLETEALGSCIQHVFYETGRTALERRVRRIEQWVRQGFLGAGAYGTVNLEKCVTDGDQTARLRAVKQIKKYIVPGEELDYARELEAVIKFSHPRYSHCFVTSHGWYESDDSVFITMEYLAYRDLQRYLVRPLPEDEAVQIVAQVLEGLQYMHGNGFVHRDLKPGNIMVVTKSPDWFVKIADFGISKRRRQDVTTLATLQRGTMGFMAPEVLGYTDGGTYTSLVDMWSLGAVAYIVLTSVSPFPTMADLTSYVLRKKGFPAILLQTHHVSELAQDFITKLMICDPNERPTAYSAGQHGWLYTETPRFTEERFHRTEYVLEWSTDY